MRAGDIVRTPNVGGAFGNKAAIVTKIKAGAITVQTGKAELVYEPEALRPCGSIKLGRSYATHGGKRFRVCMYTGINGAYREVHPCVRDTSDLGEETRALEVRKLAFAALTQTHGPE